MSSFCIKQHARREQILDAGSWMLDVIRNGSFFVLSSIEHPASLGLKKLRVVSANLMV
jgi:hypothetical protein